MKMFEAIAWALLTLGFCGGYTGDKPPTYSPTPKEGNLVAPPFGWMEYCRNQGRDVGHPWCKEGEYAPY